MTARARLLDYVLLAGGVWLTWILLFQWAGPEALSPPGATLRRVGVYLTPARSSGRTPPRPELRSPMPA